MQQKTTYYIRTKFVKIIGPELQGKTTFAKLIQKSFSGKSALISHNPNEKEEQRDYKLELASEVSAASRDSSNELVIVDTRFFMKKEIEDFFNTLKYFMKGISQEDFTLIKMNVSYDRNMEYADKAGRSNKARIIDQRSKYAGEGGSLYSKCATNEMHFFDNRAFKIEFVA